MQSEKDPIVAQATATGRAGIGILRLSGDPAAIEAVAEQLFPGKIKTPRYAYLVTLKDEKKDVIDEVIAIYFAAPHSYTGEAVLELQSHGGPVVLERVLKETLKAGSAYGLRLARAGEFTERAFLNGRMDLTQAEAVADLIDAGSTKAARAAARSLQGAFSKKIYEFNEKLFNLRAYVEATLDFPEDEVDFIEKGKITEQVGELLNQLKAIETQAMRGKVLRDGLCVVLVGAPNVGKSSLMNALAGEDVAIVTNVAGTTRDKIEYAITIDGLPVRLIDTAGLRDTKDVVESIGIERTLKAVEDADVVICLKDALRLNEKENDKALELIRPRLREGVPFVTLVNKLDLATDIKKEEGTLYVSAKTLEGIDEVAAKLKVLAGLDVAQEGDFIARTRHLQCLSMAREHLRIVLESLDAMNLDIAAEELRLAGMELDEIVGKTLPDDILGKIFSTFCIGK